MTLHKKILKVIAANGITKFTEVQESVIPLLQASRDVIVQSPTGTGKSLAFLLPIVDFLLKKEANIKKNHVVALVISPTRELGLQTQKFLELLDFSSVFFLGGTKRNQQKSDFDCLKIYEDGVYFNNFHIHALNNNQSFGRNPQENHAFKDSFNSDLCIKENKSDTSTTLNSFIQNNSIKISKNEKALEEGVSSTYNTENEDIQKINENSVLDHKNLFEIVECKNEREIFDKIDQEIKESKCTQNSIIKPRSFVISDISKFPTLMKQENIRIVIGTPGILQHVLETHKSLFCRLEFLIFDEADKLLNSGALQNIENILSFLPKNRISGLFTATLDQYIHKLSRLSLQNPQTIKIQGKLIPNSLNLQFIILKPFQKLQFLLYLIKKYPCKRIVFFSTCSAVDFFHAFVTKIFDKTANIFKIHGKIDNSERQRQIAEFFNNGKVLFATDLAARGIDFPQVEEVVHFDVPLDPTNFIHRSGRTARNGHSGRSLLFLMQNEVSYINYLKIKQIHIEEYPQKIDQLIHRTQESITLCNSSTFSDGNTLSDCDTLSKPNEMSNSNILSYGNTLDADFDQKNLENRCTQSGSPFSFNAITQSSQKKKQMVFENTLEHILSYSTLKQIMDPELTKLAVLSFVSYIRSYKEYHLSYILVLKEINFNSTAALFFLDKIPNMKEIQHIKFKRFLRGVKNNQRKKRHVAGSLKNNK